MFHPMRYLSPLLCLCFFHGCDRSGAAPKTSQGNSPGAAWNVDSQLVSRYGALPGPGKTKRSDGLESRLEVCLRRSFDEPSSISTWVAVCRTVVDAPHAQAGGIDLLVFSDSLGTSRMVAETTGLESGSFGEPGEVTLVGIGPHRRAFALSSSFSGMGSMIETADWYLLDGAGLRGVLSSQLYVSNEGMSPCDEDSLACRWEGRRLEIDSSSRKAGLFDLVVSDSARDVGKFLDSKASVTYDVDSGRYVLPMPLIPEFW
ncbi:MAG: hypothetical protein IPN71_02800 [Fibrobacteres bacterium]|jgi:hypothetical protein|nr:hypothetical protein [Fibrobacterota bacterium]